MNEEVKNCSVMKCCICNNGKSGKFITINDKKYHLCCIEQLQNNWNELKKWAEEEIRQSGSKYDRWGYEACLDKMQELEGVNGRDKS